MNLWWSLYYMVLLLFTKQYTAPENMNRIELLCGHPAGGVDIFQSRRQGCEKSYQKSLQGIPQTDVILLQLSYR